MVQLGLMVGVVRTGNRGCSPRLYAKSSQADVHLHRGLLPGRDSPGLFSSALGHTDVGLETEPGTPFSLVSYC